MITKFGNHPPSPKLGPIIEGGELTLNMPDLSTKTVALQRIQLEIVRCKICEFMLQC